MLLQDTRKEILATKLLKNLPETMQSRFVMALLGVSEMREVSREEHLILKGDEETDVGFLILQGSVEIKRDEAGGPFVNAPDVVGEMHLFTPKGRRTATVVVSIGGWVLEFEWKRLGAAARELYSDEELKLLKQSMVEYAWKRDPGLFDK